ncbi:HtaA domain-containing protein [Glutamicibacter sp. PS]|uniref:HtaA domain-containing protein n=1 Tax=Glutamicibacter TaxID=1742989 RepID=UPI00284CE35B|nr:HtaA domain-containing protein [Glutamicibacter sp. PS]MDR4531957.1 HtaA domain-containing protein [Glutamicibacter sp. PS]
MTSPAGGDALKPHLLWGVKSSFVGYISSLPDGRIEAHDGVWQQGRALAFPQDYVTEVPEGEYWFRGKLSFAGHGGMMKLDIAKPRIVHGPAGLQLSIDTDDARVAIADLQQTDSGEAFGMKRIGYTVTLTDAGSALFNGQYPAGSEMDPINITLLNH